MDFGYLTYLKDFLQKSSEEEILIPYNEIVEDHKEIIEINKIDFED